MAYEVKGCNLAWSICSKAIGLVVLAVQQCVVDDLPCNLFGVLLGSWLEEIGNRRA